MGSAPRQTRARDRTRSAAESSSDSARTPGAAQWDHGIACSLASPVLSILKIQGKRNRAHSIPRYRRYHRPIAHVVDLSATREIPTFEEHSCSMSDSATVEEVFQCAAGKHTFAEAIHGSVDGRLAADSLIETGFTRWLAQVTPPSSVVQCAAGFKLHPCADGYAGLLKARSTRTAHCL